MQVNDKDNFHNRVQLQRDQYRDTTGLKLQKMKEFYSPFTADETFEKRHKSTSYITDYPSYTVAAKEFVR